MAWTSGNFSLWCLKGLCFNSNIEDFSIFLWLGCRNAEAEAHDQQAKLFIYTFAQLSFEIRGIVLHFASVYMIRT